MNVEIKGDNLVITVPIRKPLEPSKSGKSLVVATSNGNLATSAVIDGKPVIVGFNAYVKR
jgi:hypothetical protein